MKLNRNNRSEPEQLFADESIFALQNRMLGVRGVFAEGYHQTYPTNRGTYINGIYDTFPYIYGEKGYGYPDNGQVMVNLPDGQTIYVIVDGMLLNMNDAEIIDLKRSFDLEKGYTIRTTQYQLPNRYLFEITEKKLASLIHPEVVQIEYSIHSINYNGTIEIVSLLDANTSNYHDVNDPRIGNHNHGLYHVQDLWDSGVKISTNFTNQHVVALMDHSIDFGTEWTNRLVTARKKETIEQGETILFKKTLVYTSDAYHKEPLKMAQELLTLVKKKDLFFLQEKHLRKEPLIQPIKVYGNDDINQAVHYNLFQLSMSGAYDQTHQIPAKGLSGEGYEGHYFWDTETYMFPYFLLTNTSKARDILMFRYHTLAQAKEEARRLGHEQGAKYPWRTINGDEVSSYYPAGTAQYHINAIIAYSYITYFQVTNDLEFMLQFGLEVLYETAKIYLEIGTFIDGAFHINNITGPDEYSAIVNNNYYTNKMAQYHIDYLLGFIEKYRQRISIELDQNLLDLMASASQTMVIPYDDVHQIHLQDDAFLTRKNVDIKSLNRPLLLHYHPLTIYRMKAIKQADVALGYVLLDDEKKADMTRSVSYYERYTTHDSSLSKCMYSVIHARLNNLTLAEQYFNEQWSIDLDNSLGNTQYGLHVANLGGTYLTIVYGFLGLRIHKDILEINPQCPSDWDGYQVTLKYHNQKMVFDVRESLKIQVEEPCDMRLYGEIISVDDSATFPLGSNHMTTYDKK